MLAAYATTLWIGSNFLIIRYLSAGFRLPATGFRTAISVGMKDRKPKAESPFYFPSRKLSMTRRMSEPPYAPAIPGRNARKDPNTCARVGFTVRIT